jgi:Mg-chelatase subunit ChlD
MTEHSRMHEAVAHLRVDGRWFALELDRIYVVGSGPRAHIRLVHAALDDSCATICPQREQLIVEDLGSLAGTWVGGRPLEGEGVVPFGTRLRFGPVEVEVVAGPPVLRAASGGAEQGFGELMAAELRRAPWFALSIALHGVLFVLLQLIDPIRPVQKHGIARIAFEDGHELEDDTVEITPEAPEIAVPETLAPVERIEQELVEFEHASPEGRGAETGPSADSAPTLQGVSGDGSIGLFTNLGTTGQGDILGGGGPGDGGDGRLSGEFRRTLTGLRETGLEIVFVVDSTGSMGPVLDASKRRMTRMLDALRAMVPDARVGIVAYRDHGPGEDYVTYALPLCRDYYRTLNFMQTIEAGGGGDRPEAVHEGIRSATAQTWRDGAKRVVVVIGDAPAHRYATRALEQTLRPFCKDGRGFVHTIMTSTDLFGSISKETKESFAQIAELGRGACVPAEDDDRILEQVLTLAIGQEFRGGILEVFEILAERKPEFSAQARDAVRRRDPEALRTVLAEARIQDGLVDGLIEAGDAAIVDALVAAMKDPEMTETGRHAAAFAVMRILALSAPPIDPLDPGLLSADRERQIRERLAGTERRRR